MSRAQTLSKTRAQAGKRPKPKSPSVAGPFLAGKKLNAVLCVLLAAATIALYSPVRGHPFFSIDDGDYVTGNPNVKSGLAWSTIKWAFTSTDALNWHPLTWLSHALDYQLFALNPAGHHWDSVLIHALNAVVLFLLLGWVTKRVGPSLLVAALFALHPLNVESVAWVAERKNVLSTLFFFLAIGAYVWYAQKPDWRRYLLMAALFAAGLMAKPMVITLPFVLLLLDYWPLGRTAGSPAGAVSAPQVTVSRLLLEKLPLLLLSATSAWITLKAQRSGMAMRSLHQFPIGIRIENAVVAYGLYLWKMLWPTRLAVFYPYPANTLPVWQVMLSALVLAGVTALAVVFRRKRYLAVGWFWFLGTLVPVIGLVQVGDQAMADRYAYVPLIGIFVMIAWGLDDWAEAKAVGVVWRVIPILCVLAALGFATTRQLSYWDNDYDMWSHTVAVTERNPFAHDAAGLALMYPGSAMTQHDLENFGTEQKRLDEARRHFERSLDLRRQLAQQNPASYLPDMATTLNNLGNLARTENRMDEARQHYAEAVKIHHQLVQQGPNPDLPDMAVTLNNLGFLEEAEKRTDEAYPHFEEALKIYRQLAQQNPATHLSDVAAALNNLGNLDRLQNRMDEAHQRCEEALKIHRQLAQQSPNPDLPEMAVTLNNLGFLEEAGKRTNEAYPHFEEALKIYRQLAPQDPDEYLPAMAKMLNELGNLNLLQKRMDEARQQYEEAWKIYRQLAQQAPGEYLPLVAGMLNNLGLLDRNQKRIEESRAHYNEALDLYRKLLQRDSKYAGDVARVEAALEELKKGAPSQ